jgi:hypothetical protein
MKVVRKKHGPKKEKKRRKEETWAGDEKRWKKLRKTMAASC